MNFQSWDRFDMGIYHHFNQTHQFFEDDYESAGLLGERQAEEVSSLLAQCNLQAEDFSAGWSRLDATRGSDITLEVSHKANDRWRHILVPASMIKIFILSIGNCRAENVSW